MPDIKETLIALFESYKCEFENCDKCPHLNVPGACSNSVWCGLADHLIANSVTVRNNDQIPEVICDRIIQDPNNGEWLHQFRFKLGDRDWAVEKKLPAELVAACVLLQQWIPVTEWLPEENGYYLCVVCVSAVNQRKEYRRKILFWEDNVWIEMENCFRTQKPLYWMPLPEMPKGE